VAVAVNGAPTTNPQGIISHSGPAAETATKLYIDAETAGTSLTAVVAYASLDTLDGPPTWTEIATLTITDNGISTTTMTNASIPADRIVAMFVIAVTGTWTDVNVTLRVKRPLSV